MNEYQDIAMSLVLIVGPTICLALLYKAYRRWRYRQWRKKHPPIDNSDLRALLEEAIRVTKGEKDGEQQNPSTTAG